MDAVSFLAESQAKFAAQASMIAIQSAVESEQQIADMVAQQAQQVQPSGDSTGTASNPPHLGRNVDTYA